MDDVFLCKSLFLANLYKKMLTINFVVHVQNFVFFIKLAPLYYLLAICCFLNTKLQVDTLELKLLQRFFWPCFHPFRPYMILKGSRPPSMFFYVQNNHVRTYIFLYDLYVSKIAKTIKS